MRRLATRLLGLYGQEEINNTSAGKKIKNKKSIVGSFKETFKHWFWIKLRRLPLLLLFSNCVFKTLYIYMCVLIEK